jgi:predicted Zn finger-like uncharacterized protein
MHLKCPHCGYAKDTRPDQFPPDVHQVECPRCGKTFDLPRTDPEDEPKPDLSDWIEPEVYNLDENPLDSQAPPRLEDRPGAAWDHLGHLGFLTAFRLTVMGALFAPARFFSSIYLRGGYGKPLLFAVITGTLGLSGALVWTVALAPPQFLTLLQNHFGVDALQMPTIILLGLLIVPVVPVLVLYLMAALTHMVLVLFRDNLHGFEATFRVTAYSFATLLLLLVPLIGHLIAFFYTVAIRVIGLIQAQETTPLKASLAVVWPYLFLLLMFNQAMPGLG